MMMILKAHKITPKNVWLISGVCRLNMIAFLMVFSNLQTQAQYAEAKSAKYTTPTFTLNSNLLSDATTGMNLGVEFKVDEQLTLKLPVTYNPWTFEDNKKFKFILTQPELRWWWCEPFSGHFLGVNADYAFYNVGGVGSNYMKNYRYQGSLYGFGISYGYQFYLAPRWSLEASVGFGYAFLDYDVYYCETCGEFVKSETRHYVGPNQIGLSLIYIIK